MYLLQGIFVGLGNNICGSAQEERFNRREVEIKPISYTSLKQVVSPNESRKCSERSGEVGGLIFGYSISSVSDAQSCLILCNPHGLQHTRLPCC